ncbi:glycosyltransferase family A protein [Marilutibacter spongiae]|uniref:Glycosyltransferase family 2 protein n=1 Tax=Marilutibacter spongiae TaxID=2025720 RepID=A0A7W3TLA1_9GAMM|nr:glycosyltransferase family A protein [Lysobacter spongiae]MBB1060425.1 glycosyltransferase family 2 protein [Lysobacter spongiae]
MLTLLTATGARPQAWGLCERLMAAQDYAGPVRWVIVDDGPEPQPVAFRRDGWTLETIRPTPHWQPGQNTQARNLLAGMEVVGAGERVVVIEDDDHYAADWLTHVAGELQRAELVGERRSRYYNIATRRAREMGNTGHASLCATAMRGGALDAFRQVLRTNLTGIDMQLWRRHRSRHLFDGNRVVGIKGLPGRGGIGMGHRQDFGTPDPGGQVLRNWIGDGARHYL